MRQWDQRWLAINGSARHQQRPAGNGSKQVPYDADFHQVAFGRCAGQWTVYIEFRELNKGATSSRHINNNSQRAVRTRIN
jgi:hypothetical protein